MHRNLSTRLPVIKSRRREIICKKKKSRGPILVHSELYHNLLAEAPESEITHNYASYMVQVCNFLSPHWLTLHLAYLVNCSLAPSHFVYAIWSVVARRAVVVSSFPFTSNATPPPDRCTKLYNYESLQCYWCFSCRGCISSISVFSALDSPHRGHLLRTPLIPTKTVNFPRALVRMASSSKRGSYKFFLLLYSRRLGCFSHSCCCRWWPPH